MVSLQLGMQKCLLILHINNGWIRFRPKFLGAQFAWSELKLDDCVIISAYGYLGT